MRNQKPSSTRKQRKEEKENEQRDKLAQHYTETGWLSNTNPTEKHVWTQVFRKGELSYFEGWTQIFRKDELRYSGRMNSGIPEGWTRIFRKDELGYSGMISYSFSNSGTRRVACVASPVISHDWGLWLRQTEHIRGKLWHRYTAMVNQLMVATVQLFDPQVSHDIIT